MTAVGTRIDIEADWESFVAEAKAKVSLTQLISEYAGVKFQKDRGSGSKGLCPFHDEDTPSFNVRDQQGYYRCFGCGASGDAFRFLQDYRNMSFSQAVREVAHFAHVTPPDSIKAQLTRQPSSGRGRQRQARSLKRPPAPRPLLLPPDNAPELIDSSGRAHLWKILGDAHSRQTTITPSAVYQYRSVDDQLIGYVLRMEGRKGKYFTQATWCDPLQEPALDPAQGEKPPGPRWVMRGFPEGSRPIYGAEKIGAAAASGQVLDGILVVEGEKACDAGQILLDEETDRRFVVVSPCGGLNAVSLMDWAGLATTLHDLATSRDSPVPVFVWPDADRLLPGRDGRPPIDRQEQFRSGVMSGLKVAAEKTGLPLPVEASAVPLPDGLADGWDIADARRDGWSGSDVLDLIGSAYSLDNIVHMETDDADDAAGRVFGSDMVENEQDPEHGTEIDVLEELAREPDESDPVSYAPYDDDLDAEREHPDTSPAQTLMTDHIRALGYNDGKFYILPKATGQISAVSPSQLTRQVLMSFAPYEDWQHLFPGSQKGPIDWDLGTDAILDGCRSAGVWDGYREMRHGARMDGGRVVFNSGSRLWVEGVGENLSPFEMTGENVYTRAYDFGHPDFEHALSADDADLQAYIDIVRSLAWRRGSEDISVMMLIGWLAVAPLCGLLSWRPHLWLDGPSGAGKSWVLSNIIKPVLGRYLFSVDSTTTEPGLRRNLHASSIPVSFDEAESDGRASRQRWEAILNLVRTAAANRGSRVVQGDGTYFVNACFLFTSIVPQLRKTADVTRFARVSLGPPLRYSDFEARVASPAEELLASGDFSRRFLGRVVKRSPDLRKTQRAIIEALSRAGLARRLADVYGTLAAGYWLLTQDGDLESAADAADWLSNQGVTGAIVDAAASASEHQDHTDLLNTFLSASVRIDGSAQNSWATISLLVRRVARLADEQDQPVPEAVAEAALKPYGLRVHRPDAPLGGLGEEPCGLVIHRNWPRLRELLADTSYTGTYDAVLLQAPGARVVQSPVRFEGVTNRGIYIPMDTIFPGLEPPTVRENPNLEGI